MKYRIQKKIRFEAAHRLVKAYTGKCNHVHGHSFEITVRLSVRPGKSLGPEGFVRDFDELKAIKSWIDENLDHAYLAWEQDPLLGSMKEYGMKVFLFEDNPTSEVIGRVILQKARETLDDERVYVSSVEVAETCTNAAIVESEE